MISINHISKALNGKEILKDISVTFDRGKTNLVIGESGSGKTVLLKCIVGLLEPDEGEIIFDQIVFNRLNAKDKRNIRKQIGMLFQGGALFDSSTIVDNVMFPMDMFTDMSHDEKLDRANFCLKRVNILDANALYPSELSGGMKKRVAIARAIALNPRYLLCDEPNSGLDPKTSIVIDNLIREITEEFNITTIVNTHDMNSVMEIGQKVVFIYEGNKAWEGSNKDILHSENTDLNNFVFATNLAKKAKGVI
jgi:phospholipid/cholesterol/gamma-HCH transport system ATP-binding protein